jgi:ribosome-interacting GTPase 1
MEKMKYVTLEEGTDFRKIAQIMTDAGFQMNHATARNVLMTSLTNLFRHISNEMNVDITEAQIKNVLRDQKVHEALADILFQAHQELSNEEQEANVH